jgi:hypothetical protein
MGDVKELTSTGMPGTQAATVARPSRIEVILMMAARDGCMVVLVREVLLQDLPEF